MSEMEIRWEPSDDDEGTAARTQREETLRLQALGVEDEALIINHRERNLGNEEPVDAA